MTKKVVCVGGAAVDRKFHASAPVELGTSNPVTSERSFGGVARNVAENLARLRVDCSVVSIVGDDDNGRALLRNLQDLGIDTQSIKVSPGHATAEYVAVLQPGGDLAIGLADMAIFEALTPDFLREAAPVLASADWVIADCNLPSATLHTLIDEKNRGSFSLAIDAVSTSKVMRLPQNLEGVDLLFLNIDEARALAGKNDASPADIAAILLNRGTGRVILTLGAAGLIAADRSGLRR